MTRLIHNLRPILVCAALAASALTLCACASAARAEQMVAGPGAVRTLSPGDPGHHQVRIAAVEGGSKTNPLWESEVGDAEFKEALVRSLTAAGYLAEDPAAASMELTANLYKLDKPLLGLDMSVTSTVRYTVMKRPDPKPIYDDNVAATGTGTVGEALIGVERLRVAEEKSIRANIESFLQRLQAALNGQANPPAK